jgi:hypothetical protein
VTDSIQQITITTGLIRDSLAGEVAPRTVDLMVGLIKVLEDKMVANLPGPLAGFHLAGRPTGKCLHTTLRKGDTDVLSIGIATDETCGNRLWRVLYNEAKWQLPQGVAQLIPGDHTRADPDRPPAPPWVAGALHAGIITIDPETMVVFGDFERCLAWGFVTWLKAGGDLGVHPGDGLGDDHGA